MVGTLVQGMHLSLGGMGCGVRPISVHQERFSCNLQLFND